MKYTKIEKAVTETENKEDFDDYKEEAKETADRLLWPNDSRISRDLVTEAKEAIDDLDCDENLTPAENREAVDAILEELIEDLSAQREKEAEEEAERIRRQFESIRIAREMQKRIEESKPAPEPPVKEKEDALPFTDMSENDPFYHDILYVYENGIMNGTSPAEFTPFGTLTRGMIVTILYRMEGEPATIYSAAFSDVPAGEWYTPGVEWAASQGIVLGFGDGTYGPSKPVTREQLAAILYRYAEFKEYPLETASPVSFASGDVSPWAAEYAALALTNRILPSDETGSARGTSPALRWEVAAVKAFLEVYD
ncbi:MAG: S-layer homology domain-containing protein [Clostridia bacterium]|nr:S-layer homology domain-containing protein [Clostridia bacterium]